MNEWMTEIWRVNVLHVTRVNVLHHIGQASPYQFLIAGVWTKEFEQTLYPKY